jgi:hypothetical protein
MARTGLSVVTVVLSVIMYSLRADAVVIEIHSGNGSVHGEDAQIHMLRGGDSPFSAPLTSADFASARMGPSAFIVEPIDGVPPWTWSAHLLSDPDARWISTSGDPNVGDTALYAVDFTLPPSTIGQATLDFRFLVDNNLGDGSNEGLFINGTPLAGSTLLGTGWDYDHYFGPDQAFPLFDITSVVRPGLNTLYINAADLYYSGGLLFHATITATEAGVPDAACTWMLLSFSLGGLAGIKRVFVKA